MHKKARFQGFNLIEMVVTLAIIATMAGLSAPSFSDWIAKSRQRNLAQALVNAIQLAKTEAAKRNSRVNLCVSADQRTCTKGGWEQGWLIYPDNNNSRTLDVDSESILFHEAGPFTGATARGNRPVAAYVSFIGAGQPQLLRGGLQMGTFTVCASGQNAINVVMAHSGRVRTEQTHTPCP